VKGYTKGAKTEAHHSVSVRLALHAARVFLDVDDCAPSGPEDAA